MRRVGQDYSGNIARSYASAGSNYAHHSASKRWACFLGREQVLFQAGPEAINQRAGSSKSGQFHGGGRSEQDARPQRQTLEIQAGGGDVLAELSRIDFVAAAPEHNEQLGRYQVRLAQIEQARLPSGEVSVPNERPGVRVAFDAMAFHQQDVALRHLAETMPAICGHGQNDALENEARHLSVRLHVQRSAAAGEGIA